jgi:hypothetical protein
MIIFYASAQALAEEDEPAADSNNLWC